MSLHSLAIRGLRTLALRWRQYVRAYLTAPVHPDPGPIRLTDLIGMAALVVALMAITQQFRKASEENVITRQDIELRGLREATSRQRQRIEEQQETIATLSAGAEVPQVTLPPPQAQIVAGHVDLSWTFNQHNAFTSYVVQVEHRLRNKPDTLLCEFVTDPRGRHSRYPSDPTVSLPRGNYFWRVRPVVHMPGASYDVTDPRTIEGIAIAQWSAFSSFVAYGSMKDRLQETGEVLVGTNFSQDTQFSNRNERGEDGGFDIDLIRVIVSGCLRMDSNGLVSYDPNACERAVTGCLDRHDSGGIRALTDSIAKSEERLRVWVQDVPAWVDWLPMLHRKELDVFVGSVTRAATREKGGVKFTRGYLAYLTQVIVKASESCNTLTCLAEKGIRLGAIESTTNHWLATLLSEDKRFVRHKQKLIEVVTSASFPELEIALDRGSIDAMVIDGTLASPLLSTREFKSLAGLEKSEAWNTYLHDERFIGHGREEFAIAVAVDVGGDGQKSGAVDHLYNQIDTALGGRPIRRFVDSLRVRYELVDAATTPGWQWPIPARVRGAVKQ